MPEKDREAAQNKIFAIVPDLFTDYKLEMWVKNASKNICPFESLKEDYDNYFIGAERENKAIIHVISWQMEQREMIKN